MSGRLKTPTSVFIGAWCLAVLLLFLKPIPAQLFGLAIDGPVLYVALATVGILFTEFIWRFLGRPSLSWNRAGVAIVGPFSSVRLRWMDVREINLKMGQIVFSGSQGITIFDLEGRWGKWWLKRLSKSYRDAPLNLLAALRAAHNHGVQAWETGEPPLLDLVARPRALYLFAFLAALLSAGLYSERIITW